MKNPHMDGSVLLLRNLLIGTTTMLIRVNLTGDSEIGTIGLPDTSSQKQDPSTKILKSSSTALILIL